MKENLKTFDNKEKYFRITELGNIIRGFFEAKPLIQANLISVLEPTSSTPKAGTVKPKE